MISVLDRVGMYLEEQHLVGGATGWTLAKGFMPATPDRVIALFEYAGSPPMAGPDLDRPGLQVRVRGDARSTVGAYAAARRQAERVRLALHAQDGPSIHPDIRAVLAQQSVFPLGYDANDRIEFACNFDCWLSRT